MDRLTELEAFTAVVEKGGFTGAARSLGVSKSAVSKHVSSLEGRLGVQLLTRTTRRVNPTEVGMLYYERARSILSSAAEADQMVTAMQEDPRGVLRIAASSDFGARILAPVLEGFLQRYGEVAVEVVLTDGYVEMQAEGYDVMIRVGEAPGGILRARKLTDLRLHLVAAPDYLDRRGRPERIEDLADHELMHATFGNAGPVWSLQSETGEIRVVRARGRFAINDGMAVAAAAERGLGIAFLPDFLVADALESGRLEPVLANLPPRSEPVVAIAPPAQLNQPKVLALLDHLSEHFGGGSASGGSMPLAARSTIRLERRS